MTPRTLVTMLAAAAALALPATASADVVTDWNRTLVDALYTAHAAPQAGTRAGAIVQAAVFDAVNGVNHRYEQFHPEVLPAGPPHATSAPAAAAAAAYTALVALFPAQKPTFDAQLASTLASLADDDDAGGATAPPVARGLAWGQAVANAVLAWRAGDGATATLPAYVAGPLPFWQPTPPAFAAPVFRQFASMPPWSMTSPSQFLPAAPPALTSARYTRDFAEVAAVGNAATAAPADVATARFWNGQFDTVTTIWNRVAESLAATRDWNIVDEARFFALTNAAMADAVIAVWNAKNTYNAWRPITAIRNADLDGNPDTAADPLWTPVLTTPAHQEYPSGHSGVSAAAATVFASFFGDATTFTVASDGIPGAPRTYASFSAALDEIAFARIAGGIHFRFSCDVARQVGDALAGYTLATQMVPLHGGDR